MHIGSNEFHRADDYLDDPSGVVVAVPDDPPVLTHGAARVLLRILLKAQAKAGESGSDVASDGLSTGGR